MSKNLVARRKNSKLAILFFLGLAQYHMKDWKGKDGTKTQENLMDIQARIMDVQEIPFEEFTDTQLDLFTEEREVI